MLKRLWLVLAGGWALLARGGGMGREPGGLEPKDFVLAFAPGFVAWLVFIALRFVVTGSVRRSPVTVFRSRP